MRNLALMTLLMLSLTACDSQGPAERAGEEIDEAVDALQRDAEDMQEDIDDAIDDVRQDAEEAAEDLQEKTDPGSQ
jgi:prefoldin subunit 5